MVTWIYLEKISEKEENVVVENKSKLSPPVHLCLPQHGSQNHGGGTSLDDHQQTDG